MRDEGCGSTSYIKKRRNGEIEIEKNLDFISVQLSF